MNTLLINATATALNKQFQNIKINNIKNSINSVTNTEFKKKLAEMLTLYEYKKLLNNARGKSNLKTIYNAAVQEYNFRRNKPYNFNKIRTTMEALKTAMNNTQNRFGVTSAMNSANRKPRVSGTIVKNKLGKAYFINRAGGRHPVIGTNKKTGRYMFNKTGQQGAQNYSRVKKGEIQVA
jgi:hypothetical protein